MSKEPSSSRLRFVDRDPLRSRPAIDLVRDPSLLPAGREGEVGEFWRTVERYRVRLEELGVLTGLGPQQQKELAAVVLDLDCQYQDWTSHRPYYQRLKVRSKRGPGHVRKLVGKLRQIQADLQALAGDAEKIDKEFADAVVPHVSEALAILARVALVPRRQTLPQYTARLARSYEQSRSQRLQPDDPRGLAATQVSDYLRASMTPAIDVFVRTAKIGNALWAWGYKITPNDLGVEDCPAIRMLIARRRATRSRIDPNRPTLHKSTGQ